MVSSPVLDKFINSEGKPVQVCGSCNFYMPRDDNPTAGLCRRYPPQIGPGKMKGETFASFPSMFNYGWCGEWKANDPDKMVL